MAATGDDVASPLGTSAFRTNALVRRADVAEAWLWVGALAALILVSMAVGAFVLGFLGRVAGIGFLAFAVTGVRTAIDAHRRAQCDVELEEMLNDQRRRDNSA